jgi:DNA-binding response OmpR family regulator
MNALAQVDYLRERVAELEAEVADLRRELRVEAEQHVIDALRRRYRLQPSRATIVALLYAAAPRAVAGWALLEAIPSRDRAHERSDAAVKVHVHFIRQALGREAIETAHGRGYRLSEAGKALVEAAIAQGLT